MRTINLENWSRREHFEFYSRLDYPYFSMCTNVDLTAFYQAVKKFGGSFNIAMVYIIARAANAIPEFRYRIRSGSVIEHEVVHPSSTILAHDDVFSFCDFDYVEDYKAFAEMAEEQIALMKRKPTLKSKIGKDDQLFMTAIPWVSFTSFMHPLHLHPADSIPRFAWGKFFQEGAVMKMPLSVQGHHALMDGLHVGLFYEEIQKLLGNPVFILDTVQRKGSNA